LANLTPWREPTGSESVWMAPSDPNRTLPSPREPVHRSPVSLHREWVVMMLTRLRLLSPLGVYPVTDIVTDSGRFIIERDIAFLITVSDSVLQDSGSEIFSEVEYLTLEEIRFLGCITVSRQQQHGLLMLYPIPLHKDIPFALMAPRGELLIAARRYALSLQEICCREGIVLPSVAGGPGYRQHHEADEGLVRRNCSPTPSRS
jgi:hypothetical protein